MKPYYQEPGITIYHGDAREVCPALPMTDVDACITDPPYGDTSLEWDKPAREWIFANRRRAETLSKPLGFRLLPVFV